MRYIFKLPDIGEGTAEAEIVAWHVAIGEQVREDQLLVDVMTDKATVEMTSPVAGTVVALTGKPGEMATVGAPLVEFETDAEAGPVEKPEKPLAAPAVRARAAESGVALDQVRGSGPDGRITHADLDAHVAKPAPRVADEVEAIKLTGLRRRIAERMDAARQIPHFAYIEEIDMTALESLRTQLNTTPGRPKLTLLPFLMRALVRALPEFPQMNAHFDAETGIVKRFRAVHIGIAAQTGGGLMVPVVRHAERRSLWNAATEIVRLAERARSNKASKDELGGSTITLTSLGTLGGIATTPILNPPEVAIIAPNAIRPRPIVHDGQIAVRKLMNLSSCFDHRIVDGADAAAFVQRLKTLLEQPALLFLDDQPGTASEGGASSA